jgi:hypothetical protein
MVQKHAPVFQLANFQIQSIYPNPTLGNLDVITSGADLYEWMISDLTGRVVSKYNYTQPWERNYLQLNVSNLTNGLYHLTIVTAEGKSTTMFQKISE